MAAGETVV